MAKKISFLSALKAIFWLIVIVHLSGICQPLKFLILYWKILRNYCRSLQCLELFSCKQFPTNDYFFCGLPLTIISFLASKHSFIYFVNKYIIVYATVHNHVHVNWNFTAGGTNQSRCGGSFPCSCTETGCVKSKWNSK